MMYSVSSATIICIWIVLVLCAALVILPFIFIKKKYKADSGFFLIGALIFVCFAIALESAPKQLILASLLSRGASNVILALSGALLAGLFEETGRLFAFNVLLKKKRGNDGNALMYGAGHAGCEVVLLVMLAMINNLSYAASINAGNAGSLLAAVDESQAAVLAESFKQLSNAEPALFFVSVVERIAAVASHISLSVVVWAACKVPGKKKLYFLAILLHTWLDFVPGICSLNGVPTWIVEFMVYLCAALSVVVAIRVWKTVLNKKEEPALEN